MIAYDTVLPANELLRSSILQYAQIVGDGAQAKTITPRPGAVLVINIEGSFKVDGALAPVAAVTGIRERPYRFDPDSATTDRIHVNFRPCGLNRFTQVSARLLARRSIPAEEIFPSPALGELISSLAAARGLSERTNLLDRFFLDLYSPPDTFETAIQNMAESLCGDPSASLGKVLREVPMSLRHAERSFSRLVGLSPRAFLRIARFERAKNGVLARRGKALADIALDSGYYDQSHFNREFRDHAAMPPGSFRFCAPPIDTD